MVQRRADDCPFHRPFPRGFSECPAFRPAPMETVDSRHRPLPAGNPTCVHLEVGVGATPGRFYARCGLGTPAERERWARQHGGPPAGDPEVAVSAAERRAARRPAG